MVLAIIPPWLGFLLKYILPERSSHVPKTKTFPASHKLLRIIQSSPLMPIQPGPGQFKRSFFIIYSVQGTARFCEWYQDGYSSHQYPSFFVIYLLKHPQPYVHYPLNTHPVSGAGIRTGFRVVNRTKMAPWYQDVLFWLDNFYDSPFYMLGHFPDSFHPSPLGWFIFLKGSGPHGVPYPLRVRVSPWAW